MMRKRLFLFLSILAALATGCGGGYSGAPAAKSASSYPAQGGGYGQAPDDAPQSAPGGLGAYGGDYAPRAPSPSPAAEKSTSSGASVMREETARPEPRERPGLGTQWGESRSSRVHDVTFVRADEDRPFAMATLHYNDRQGILALAQYHQDRQPDFREVSSAGGAVTVSIRDENQNPLEGFRVGDRNYVVGNAGQRYAIVMTNHTGHRFEVVTTVDGLDVINGQSGTLQNRGYVLMPYATLDIEGFRQSHEAVAAFRFASVRDSYAAQTGSARNVGVIGVAFFAERGDQFIGIDEHDLHLRDTAIPFPGADSRFAKPPPGR